MKLTIAFIAAATLGAVSGSALAADIEAGKKKAAEVCAACHGPDGAKTQSPDQPKLAGQHADYLARALRDYKSGARKDAVMGAMAQPLSSKDIDNLAAWFASQSGLSTRY